MSIDNRDINSPDLKDLLKGAGLKGAGFEWPIPSAPNVPESPTPSTDPGTPTPQRPNQSAPLMREPAPNTSPEPRSIANLYTQQEQKPALSQIVSEGTEEGKKSLDGVLLVRMNGKYYGVQASEARQRAQDESYVPVNTDNDDAIDLYLKSVAEKEKKEGSQYAYIDGRYVELHELPGVIQRNLREKQQLGALDVVEGEQGNTFQLTRQFDNMTGEETARAYSQGALITAEDWKKKYESLKAERPMVFTRAQKEFDYDTPAMAATKGDDKEAQYVPVEKDGRLYYARTVGTQEDYLSNSSLQFFDDKGNPVAASHDVVRIGDEENVLGSLKGSRSAPQSGEYVAMQSKDGVTTYIPLIEASGEAQEALARSGIHPLKVQDEELRLPSYRGQDKPVTTLSRAALPELENGRMLSSSGKGTATVSVKVEKNDPRYMQETFVDNSAQEEQRYLEAGRTLKAWQSGQGRRHYALMHANDDTKRSLGLLDEAPASTPAETPENAVTTGTRVSQFAIRENAQRREWQSHRKNAGDMVYDGELTLPQNTRSVEIDYRTGTVSIGYGTSSVKTGNRYVFQLNDIERINCENCSSLEITSRGLPHSREVNGVRVGRESPEFVNTQGVERMKLKGVKYHEMGYAMNAPRFEDNSYIGYTAMNENAEYEAKMAARRAQREQEREYLAGLRHQAHFMRKQMPYHRAMFMADPSHHMQNWQDGINQGHQRRQDMFNFRQQMYMQQQYNNQFGYGNNSNQNFGSTGNNSYANNNNQQMPGMQPYAQNGMYPTPYGFGQQQQYANAPTYGNQFAQQGWQVASNSNYNMNAQQLQQMVTATLQALEQSGAITINDPAKLAAVGGNPHHGLTFTATGNRGGGIEMG